MNKKAQSGVITAVLLILISLAAVIIVWNVVQGIVEKGVGRTDTDIESMFVQLEIEEGSVNLANQKLQFSVTRGSDNAKIESLKVSLSGQDNSAPPTTFTRTYEIKKEDYELPGPLETKTYTLTNVGSIDPGNGVTLLVYAVNKEGKPSAIAAEYNTKQPVGTTITAGFAEISPICGPPKWGAEQVICEDYHTKTIRSDENKCAADDVVSESQNCDCRGWDDPIHIISTRGQCEIGKGTLTITKIDNTGCTNPQPEKEYCFLEDYISRWKFDDILAPGKDEKGVNPGALKGDAKIINDDVRANVLSLDGVGDYVSIGDPTDGSLDFDATESFTLSLWVNAIGNIGSYDMPWWKGGTGISRAGYEMELGAGSWSASISDGLSLSTSIKTISFGNVPGFNTWTMLTIVVDRTNNNFRAYKNRAQVGIGLDISKINSIENTQSATIGATNTGIYPFNGLIDEVMIYNRALTAAEVQGIYCSQGGYPTDTTNCPQLL